MDGSPLPLVFCLCGKLWCRCDGVRGETSLVFGESSEEMKPTPDAAVFLCCAICQAVLLGVHGACVHTEGMYAPYPIRNFISNKRSVCHFAKAVPPCHFFICGTDVCGQKRTALLRWLWKAARAAHGIFSQTLVSRSKPWTYST